ncbi:MAG: aspartate aminotransferase family protein [Salinirussus sp.]
MRDHSAEDSYVERTDTSRSYYEEARKHMPGGNTRTGVQHAPHPTYIEAAEGAYVSDVDGNEYLDFVNNMTSLIHGHGAETVVEPTVEAIRSTSAPGAPTPTEIEYAAHFHERVPGLDAIRFTNSGTEAVMNAVRAARAHTGNDVIAKIEGLYHGSFDEVQVSVHPPLELAGPADAPESVPNIAGVPDSTAENVLTLPFNDRTAALDRLEAHRDELAGVLVAPYMGTKMIPGEEAFIQGLADWADEAEVPFIFDEVVSFRFAYGGSHTIYDVTPDVMTFGKVVGGGFPVGAVGGTAEFMSIFGDSNGGPRIPHSGTFNANLATVTAGLAAMEAYDQAAVDRLNDLSADLADGVEDVLADRNLDIQFHCPSSIFKFYFTADPVENYRDSLNAHADIEKRLFFELMDEDIRLAPPSLPTLLGSLSTAMDDADIERFLDALDVALARTMPEIQRYAPTLIAD